MLPLLDLSLLELEPSADFLQGNPTQAIDFAPFDAIFTDAMRAPILAGQADIESLDGNTLPENGNPLPPPPLISPGLTSLLPLIDGEQRVDLQELMNKSLGPKDKGPLQPTVTPPVNYPEITRAANLNANREVRTAAEIDLHVRPDEGQRRMYLGPVTRLPKPDAVASTSAPVARSPLEIGYSPTRGLTEMSLPLELPIVDVPAQTFKHQAARAGAQYTGATPKAVMSSGTKDDGAPPPDPRLEPIELRLPADGQRSSAQVTPAVPSSTVAGNTTAATTPPINWPAAAPGASMVSTPAQLVTDISIPVLDPQWGTVLNERVNWMANRNIQNAEIRMNPAELGPLRVQVSIDEGSAQVIFDAQHAVTREAIELALPRLREMLSENGLLLTDVSVSDQEINHGQEGVERESTSDSSSTDGSLSDEEDASGPATAHSRARSRIVDTFV